MSYEIPDVTWGFGTEAAKNLNVSICTATLTPIGLDKTHPKQVKCFYEKKHKNHSQTFILHYKTWAVVSDRKYVLEHAIQCIIATLAKSVFKILAFTFLYEIGIFSAKTAGDATICTNLNCTYTRIICVPKLRILFSHFREEDV